MKLLIVLFIILVINNDVRSDLILEYNFNNSQTEFVDPIDTSSILDTNTYTDGTINLEVTSQSSISWPVESTGIRLEGLDLDNLNRVASNRLVSLVYADKLKTIITTTKQFALEIWYRPLNTTMILAPIFSINNFTADNARDVEYSNTMCIDNGLILYNSKGCYMNEQFVSIRPFTTTSEGECVSTSLSGCEYPPLSELPSYTSTAINKVHHTVVNARITTVNATHGIVAINMQQRVVGNTTFINNVTFIKYASGSDLFLFQNNSYVRIGQIFGSFSSEEGFDYFKGDIYYAALYSKQLNDTEIATKFNAGISNSIPLITPTTITINGTEDVMFSVNIDDLFVITDFDNTVFNRNQTLVYRIISVTGNAYLYYHANSSSGLIRIDQFPVTINQNKTIFAVNQPYVSGNPAFTVNLAAFDGIKHGKFAFIQVNLAHVNHLPFTQNSSTTDIFTVLAVNNTIIPVALDYDPEDVLLNITITQFPSLGLLFTADNYSSVITSSHNTIINSTALRYYTTYAPLHLINDNDVFAVDYFKFKATDTHGNMSTTESTVTIYIRNYVRMSPIDQIVVDKNSQVVVGLYGSCRFNNDVDEFIIKNQSLHGTSVIYQQTLVYQPIENYVGEDSVYVAAVCDGIRSHRLRINITIIETNDTPVIDNYDPRTMTVEVYNDPTPTGILATAASFKFSIRDPDSDHDTFLISMSSDNPFISLMIDQNVLAKYGNQSITDIDLKGMTSFVNSIRLTMNKTIALEVSSILISCSSVNKSTITLKVYDSFPFNQSTQTDQISFNVECFVDESDFLSDAQSSTVVIIISSMFGLVFVMLFSFFVYYEYYKTRRLGYRRHKNKKKQNSNMYT